MPMSFLFWGFRAVNLPFLELTKRALHFGWVPIQSQPIAVNSRPEQSLSQQLVSRPDILIRDYSRSQDSIRYAERTGQTDLSTWMIRGCSLAAALWFHDNRACRWRAQ